MSQLHSKQSAKAPPPKNSQATGGSFKHNTFLVTVLDWLKKERKKMNDSVFGRFRFAPLKWLLYVAITTVDRGKLFKLLCVLQMLAFAPR